MNGAPVFGTALMRDAGIRVPVVCGAMYPCSNPALIAAVSEAGGLGVVQPIALTHVHGYEFQAGLRAIRSLTAAPVALNVPIDTRSRAHQACALRWVEVALSEGVRFFITSGRAPQVVARQIRECGGAVFYHEVRTVVEARDAVGAGAAGVVCVNAAAGGQAGSATAEEMLDACAPLDVPLVCAGGIGDTRAFVRALQLGYAGVIMGTRFIATVECTASQAYKEAILRATARDIVHTERMFGSRFAIIASPGVAQIGMTVGPLERMLLRYPVTRRWLRARDRRRAGGDGGAQRRPEVPDYWSAGTSVDSIHEIKSTGSIVRDCARACRVARVCEPDFPR